MDSFQGCYKDGTEPGTRDYRWFAAVPIMSRFIAFTLLSVTLNSTYYPWGTVVVVSTLVLTIISQPYKYSTVVCLCVCVDCYSCSKMNSVQVRVSIGV